MKVAVLEPLMTPLKAVPTTTFDTVRELAPGSEMLPPGPPLSPPITSVKPLTSNVAADGPGSERLTVSANTSFVPSLTVPLLMVSELLNEFELASVITPVPILVTKPSPEIFPGKLKSTLALPTVKLDPLCKVTLPLPASWSIVSLTPALRNNSPVVSTTTVMPLGKALLAAAVNLPPLTSVGPPYELETESVRVPKPNLPRPVTRLESIRLLIVTGWGVSIVRDTVGPLADMVGPPKFNGPEADFQACEAAITMGALIVCVSASLLVMPARMVSVLVPPMVKGLAVLLKVSERMSCAEFTLGNSRVAPPKMMLAVPLAAGVLSGFQLAAVVQLSSMPPPSQVWAETERDSSKK